MKTLFIGAVSLLVVSAGLVAQQPGQPAAGSQGLRVIVISGEDSVNILQQRTAVAAVVEVRDRNNLPVSGAIVQFAIDRSGAGASAVFANGQTAVTAITDITGRAALSQLQATGAGTLRINVQASFQGQVGTAAISQTNAVSAAEASKLALGPGQAGGTSGGAAAAGGSVASTVGAVAAAAVTAVTAVTAAQETPSCQATGDRALAAITTLASCPAGSPQCTQAASDATTFLGEWCSCAGGRSQLEVEAGLRGSSVAELQREAAIRGIQFPGSCR